MTRIGKYLSLPKQISEFERSHLERVNRAAFLFFLAHLPVFMIVAAIAGTGVLKAGLLTALMLVGPAVAYKTMENPRNISKVFAVASMGMGGLLVHFGQGSMQIEMHFYFFVVIALLSVFANPSVIVIAASTVVVHHGLLYFLMPRSVFNYEASIWSVAVHGLFVLVESIAACFVARNFFDAVIGLERKVDSRTKELAHYTRDLKLVLDNVDQGFLTLAVDGTIARGRSAVLETWLGPVKPDAKIWEYIGPSDSGVARGLAVGWSAIEEDVLPLELVLDQMPRTMVVHDRTLELSYKPIFDNGALSALLLVFTDVSERIERERIEEEHREFLAVYALIVKDESAAREAMNEANDLVSLIVDPKRDLLDLRRDVHTLKGSAGLLGLVKVAALCHAIEEGLALEGRAAATDLIATLSQHWRGFTGSLTALFGDGKGKVQLTENEYATLLFEVETNAPRGRLRTFLENLRRESAESKLGRLAEQARALGRRLNKGELNVVIEPNGVRLEQGEYQHLWSALSHLIRNAIDHGIEPADVRVAAGKAAAGTLVFTTTQSPDTFVFQIRDDGCGIDWAAVAARANARGLETATRADLVDALFADGLTTKLVVSEYSGRGIGLSAVRKACDDLGGEISVESEPGSFTTVRICVKKAQARLSNQDLIPTIWPVVRASLQPRQSDCGSFCP